MRPLILLATRNPGKLREIRAILSGVPIDIGALDFSPGIPSVPEIEETGSTLEENAFIKARTVFGITGLPAIADDTGLEVDALGGAPGIYSARYAGENATYDDNTRKLLDALSGVGEGRRTARFRCVAAYAGPGGEYSVEGRCEGKIASSARGTRGFGYDPIFLPDGYDRSFAELPAEGKNAISHRSAAFRKMGEYLRRIY